MATDNTSDHKQDDGQSQAADLIRQKLAGLYDQEPSAKAEAKEIAQQGRPHSKHQQYMSKLSNSSKSVAEIQTAWHEYYQALSDDEKREVWDEFYSQSQPAPGHHTPEVHHSESGVTTVTMPKPETEGSKQSRKQHKAQTFADHKQHIVHRSRAKQKLSAKHHFQSIVFGLGIGAFVVVLLLFGFFNERFIAPFITPSRQVNSTPIIADPNSTAIGNDPKIIIPKINLEIPVVYDEPSIAEGPMQKALERGVVHYANTPNPGQKGNVVIFGHSSNNIFNPGKYKFAFVLLSKMENGDTFYLDKDGKRYVYQIYKKHIVNPTQVEVLNTAEKPDTATLITCDPPGTSLKRLVVVGEQISPSASDNKADTASKPQEQQPASIPSNSTSLWQRFTNWL